jgi:endonuclease YncB( thermonuclease family)
MKRILILSILIILPVFLAANTVDKSIHGKVVNFVDGDTIDILTAGYETVRVRFAGIDCPERSQPFGKIATEFTINLCKGKEVTAVLQPKDRYGRPIADIILPDGKNLSQELVKAGLAWWYRQYAPNDKTLENLEAEARAAKRGLWSEPNPAAPWDYRKSRKK